MIDWQNDDKGFYADLPNGYLYIRLIINKYWSARYHRKGETSIKEGELIADCGTLMAAKEACEGFEG